jgi:hypothetical protein
MGAWQGLMGDRASVTTRNLHTTLCRLAPEMGLNWGHMDLGLPNPQTVPGTVGSVETCTHRPKQTTHSSAVAAMIGRDISHELRGP